jgi:TolA-binding protein
VWLVAERSARLRAVSPAIVTLDAGTVWVDFRARHRAAPFAVDTPRGRVSVAGTRFAVSVSPSSGLAVAVQAGRVAVATPAGVHEVSAGFHWRQADDVEVPLDARWLESFATLLPPPAAPPLRPDGTLAVAVQDSDGRSTPPLEAPAAPGGTAAEPAQRPASTRPANGDAGAGRETTERPAAAQQGSAAPTTDPSAEDLYHRAEAAMTARRWAEAAELLERAAEAARGSPLRATALMDLGRRRVQLGRDDLAALAYRDYLDEFPRGDFRGEARIALCRIHVRAGRAGDACACYGAYLAEQPHGPYAEEAAARCDTRGDGEGR